MAARLPTLSNANQLKIMQMVKEGLSIDEAIARATSLEKKEKAQVRGFVKIHWPSEAAR